MFLRKLFHKRWVGLSLLLISTNLFAQGYSGPVLGEREFQTINEHYVNTASGTISYSMTDLSIGSGDLGLVHGFTINSNDAMNFDALVPGPKDKYLGGIRLIKYSVDPNTSPYNAYVEAKYFEVIAVYDHESTYYFTVNTQGKFEELGDQLVTLTTEQTDTFLLTKTDGTEVRYNNETPIPSNGIFPAGYDARGYMREIKRPDGFTITIHRDSPYLTGPITSVNSNNGLQLKYIYEQNIRPLEVSKRNQPNNGGDNGSFPAAPQNWWPYHPSKIIALNNALENCPISGQSCTGLTHDWPEVNYSWEDGMPRAFVIGESDFTVTDAMGKQTIFHHKAMSEGLLYGDSGGTVNPGLTDWYFPAIVKITEPSGNEIEYKYINITKKYGTCQPGTNLPGTTGVEKTLKKGEIHDPELTPISVSPTIGIGFCPTYTKVTALGALRSSESSGTTITYGPSNPYGNDKTLEREVTSFSFRGSTQIVYANTNYGNGKVAKVPYIVDTPTKRVMLTKDFINQVTEIKNKLNDTTRYYDYDTVGRLTDINDAGIITTYVYNVPNCTSKTCNKASEISDGYNNFQGVQNPTPAKYTSYTFSSLTGQVTSIAAPAVGSLTAKTKLYYQNYFARYKNDLGVLTNSTVPISLLQSRFHCKNSNVYSNTCIGNDKITTSYHYGSGSAANNLFLIGQTIATQGEPEVYTTCFKYDKYGNQIGHSQPKSGITDCNIGREY